MWPSALGGAYRDQECDGDLLGVLEPSGQADDCLSGHGRLSSRVRTGPARTVRTKRGRCRRGISLQIQREEGVEQAVLHREQRRSRPGRGPGLGVDALDGCLCGLRRDDEPLCDLSGGGASRDQGQNLDLTRSQSPRPTAAPTGALPGGRQDRVDRVRVEMPGPHAGPQLARGPAPSSAPAGTPAARSARGTRTPPRATGP